MNDMTIYAAFDEIPSEVARSLREDLNDLGAFAFVQEDLIYHYTTSSGLRGILESSSLWATNLSFMNDAQEMKYGLEMFEAIAESEISSASGDNDQIRSIMQTFLQLLHSDESANVYACCFSANGDQLSQWRGYGAGVTGYCIGVESRVLLSELTRFDHAIGVLYDRKEQENLIQSTVDYYFDTVDGTNEHIARVLYQLAQIMSVGLKHEGFWEEQEIRISTVIKDIAQVQVRENNGVFVPYFSMTMPENKKLPIREIIIGPTADFERAALGLRYLLDMNNYSNVAVKKSDIPYRKT